MDAVKTRDSCEDEPAAPVAVVMAKVPVAGAVKTRLIGNGIDADAAAEIALSMLGCTCRRLRSVFPYLALAVSPDDAAGGLANRLDLPFNWVGGQSATGGAAGGGGDLGERMARVARNVAENEPVAFFGMDSPDVPFSILTELCEWLRGGAEDDENVAVGPTPDGGYWVLAMRSFDAAIVRDIDWGTRAVYDQTCVRIRDAGRHVRELPVWDDIDEIEDLTALRTRLTAHEAASDPHLSALGRNILRLIGS